MICSGDLPSSPPWLVGAGSAGASSTTILRSRAVYDYPEIKGEVEQRSAEVNDRHSGALMANAQVDTR